MNFAADAGNAFARLVLSPTTFATWCAKRARKAPAISIRRAAAASVGRHRLHAVPYGFGAFASDTLIKLGLLGTIIGFIIMLAPIAGLDAAAPHAT